MSRQERLFRRRIPALVVPVLFSLGGCAAVPLIELAAASSNGNGIANMMQQFVPNSGGAQSGQADAQRVSAQDAANQDPNCPDGSSGTSSAACNRTGRGSAVQTIAGSLQKLVPGSLFSH